MGERQKGRSDLKLASLRRDRKWVERAREVAIEIVDGPGGLGATRASSTTSACSSTRTTRTSS
jgi:RecG-like helicase